MQSFYRHVQSWLLLTVFSVVVCVDPVFASRMFTSGFEENDSTATMWTSTFGTPTFTTTAPHSGTYAFQADTTSGDVLTRNFATAMTSGTIYGRYYFKTDAGAGLNAYNPIVQYRTNGSSNSLNVRFNGSTKVLQLYNALSTNFVTSTITLTAGTWYRIETRLLIADAPNGQLEMQLYEGDSTTPLETALSLTSEDTLPTSIFSIQIGNIGSTNWGATAYFEDIALNSDAGTFQNSWPGPGKIYLLVPNTEVSTSFTPLSGTDNSLMVDDLPGAPDDDTTYNSYGTANGEDRLGLTSLGAEVTSDATIRLADVYGRIRGDGTTGTRQMRMLIWDDGGAQTNGPTTALNDSTAYAIMSTADHIVLDTSGKTKTNLASFDVGYEPLTNNNTFVTAVWVNVEWIEAVAASQTFFQRRLQQ